MLSEFHCVLSMPSLGAPAMLVHLQRPSVSRPRPETYGGLGEIASGPGGEGGNSWSRLAATVGPNALLAAALVLSATLVGLTTAALH
jgi:hypothetical protein